MFNLESNPGRTCIIEGKEHLFFSGYSYLGMNHVPEFNNFIKEGIDKYGSLFPSSRISNTRLQLYSEFETALSSLTGMPATVTFSSGYLAGLAITSLLNRNKNIFVAPGTHPAIYIPQGQLCGNTFDEWGAIITARINNSKETQFILVSDSLNILLSNIHDFSFLSNIEPGKKIIYLIDDSHGLGIFGKKGEGIISALPSIEGIDYVLSYSLSKGLNIPGGAVSGSIDWCNALRQTTFYSSSTAINPSFAYAFLKSGQLYLCQKEKLENNILFLTRILIGGCGSNYLNHLPIWVCDKPDAEDMFLKQRIIISSFSYPLPQSKKINRIVVSALHQQRDLEAVASVLNQHKS